MRLSTKTYKQKHNRNAVALNLRSMIPSDLVFRVLFRNAAVREVYHVA